jgi:hypothetical protein
MIRGPPNRVQLALVSERERGRLWQMLGFGVHPCTFTMTAS